LIEYFGIMADDELASVEILIVCAGAEGKWKNEDAWIHGGSVAPPQRQSLSTV